MAASRAFPPAPRTAALPAPAAQFLLRSRGLPASGTPRSPPPSLNRRAHPPGKQIRPCAGSPAGPSPPCSKLLVPARALRLPRAPAARQQVSASASCPCPSRPAKSSSPAAPRETTHLEKYRLRRSQCEHPRIGWLDRNRREL